MENASNISKGIVGHLNIGFLNAAAKRFLPKVIRSFKQEYPNINVKLNYYQPDHLFEKLRSDEVDLAFTISAGLPRFENIEYRTLYKPNNYLVVYEDHMLASKNEFELNELIHESFVMVKRETSPESYDQWVSLYLEYGYSPMVVEQVESFDTIITLVEAGVGIGDEDRYFEGNREAWKALEEAYKAGKLRAIGVSNFQKEDLDNILSACTVKPMVNQILAHISNTPFELIQYTQEQGILVEAYSPIAHGELLKNKKVVEIADKYGVSVPQLSIEYVLQLGLLPLPKTANPEHMKNNAEVDFIISEEDMEFLINLERIKDYGEASGMPVFGGKLQ